MQQVILFLIRKKEFLFFMFLFAVSVGLTIQKHSYHKSKFVNATSAITGRVYEFKNEFSTYLNLANHNQKLQNENAQLRAQLSNININSVENYPEETPYEVIPARLIQQSYHKKENILLINRGAKHGVEPDMGVITTNGIVGVVASVGEEYATVLSVLHTASNINAQLKKTNHIGALTWNGDSPFQVQLEDFTKVTPVIKNDTIVTGDYSIFPQGIPIGAVTEAVLDYSQNFYKIQVQLFADMTNIGHVYVIKNTDKKLMTELISQQANE